MTPRPVTLLLLLALLLPGLTFATACGTPPVPQPPTVACPLPTWPTAPVLSPGSDAAGNVTLSPSDAVKLGEYVRGIQRWAVVAKACLGDPPHAALSSSASLDGPTPTIDGPVPAGLGSMADLVTTLAPGAHFEHRLCDAVNAYASPETDTVVLCDELVLYVIRGYGPVDGVRILRYAVAHEAGHLVIARMHIPVIGSEEVAADEFAAVRLVELGEPEDLAAGARFWADKNRPEDPEDDHPSDARRAYVLGCYYRGATRPDLNPMCTARLIHAAAVWAVLTED